MTIPFKFEYFDLVPISKREFGSVLDPKGTNVAA